MHSLLFGELIKVTEDAAVFSVLNTEGIAYSFFSYVCCPCLSHSFWSVIKQSRKERLRNNSQLSGESYRYFFVSILVRTFDGNGDGDGDGIPRMKPQCLPIIICPLHANDHETARISLSFSWGCPLIILATLAAVRWRRPLMSIW